MANPSTANEPSMEEILASIRQIISEDGEGSSAGRPEARSADPAEQDGALDSELAAVPPPAKLRSEKTPDQGGSMKSPMSQSAARTTPQLAAPSGASAAAPASSAPSNSAPNVETRRMPDAPPVENPVRSPLAAQRHTAPAEPRNLLSDRSNAAVSGAFGTLTHTILAQHARTLDDLVAEMLRPMLKEWLDDNLPPLVERLVKEEIERVSRGRR